MKGLRTIRVGDADVHAGYAAAMEMDEDSAPGANSVLELSNAGKAKRGPGKPQEDTGSTKQTRENSHNKAIQLADARARGGRKGFEAQLRVALESGDVEEVDEALRDKIPSRTGGPGIVPHSMSKPLLDESEPDSGTEEEDSRAAGPSPFKGPRLVPHFIPDELLEDDEDPEDAPRLRVEPSLIPLRSGPTNNAFSEARSALSRLSPEKKITLAVAGALLLGSSLLFMGRSAPPSPETRAPVAIAQSAEPEMKSQLQYITNILNYLVPAVRSLQAANRTPPIPQHIEQAPEPVQDLVPPPALPVEPGQADKVARIIVNRANLRAAPSMDGSVIMAVAKGSELLVEQELGDWYRILTPTGEPGWVSKTVVEAAGR